MRGVQPCWPKMAMKSKRYGIHNSLFPLASGFPLCIIIYSLSLICDGKILRLTHLTSLEARVLLHLISVSF